MSENLVIGGGVFGTGIALEIAKSGRDVRLLEKQKIASGASGGPGRRGVRANGRDVRELPLMKMAYDIWPEFHKDLDADPFFERTGNLLLIEREQDLKSAQARVWLQRQQGIPT
ncbi:MAG: FAD-dependent oxidoreductase, partial [SAR324 cluster bacterium]|nr:FAD-dependent oxidoreductase [SAR324 cluster bacterium]